MTIQEKFSWCKNKGNELQLNSLRRTFLLYSVLILSSRPALLHTISQGFEHNTSTPEHKTLSIVFTTSTIEYKT